MPSRARGLTLILVIATGVFAWAVFSNGDFRPSAVAAIIIAIGIAVGPSTWSRRPAIAVVAAAAIVVALLFTVPAGESCDLPIAENFRHGLEDASGPHDHDRCQLESDRRSIAGLIIFIGTCVGVRMLFVRRREA